MDLRQLQYFVQVARLHSFNRAASHLYVAQSALSRQVRLLEEQLGVTLFNRNARGVQLTQSGELLLERAEAVLRSVRQMRDDVAAEGTQPRGELVVGLPPSLQNMLALPLLERMTADYPQVSMTIWVGTSMVLKDMVVAGTVDIAVLGTFGAETDLVIEPLFRDQFHLVAGPAGLKNRRRVAVRQLADVPLIITSRPNSVRLLAEREAAKAGIALHVLMEVNYLPLILDLVRRGVGHTMLPYSAVDQLVQSGELSAVQIGTVEYEWAIALPKDRPMSAGARCAQQLLRNLATAGTVKSAR